nr:sensor histidine kinase [Fodinibius salicampi]
MQIEPINLNVNQAIPCGLILNELLTNAYKHAFKDRNDGQIEIGLGEEQGQVYLIVHDDGVGLPKEDYSNNASTIGMTLVNLLQQQLDAELNITNGEGTHCQLTFEKAEVKGIGSAVVE